MITICSKRSANSSSSSPVMGLCAFLEEGGASGISTLVLGTVGAMEVCDRVRRGGVAIVVIGGPEAKFGTDEGLFGL